jgi:hypothetical protein
LAGKTDQDRHGPGQVRNGHHVAVADGRQGNER